MSRNNSEEGFSLDDMMEIFGDSVESAPKKAPAAVAAPAAPAPAAPAQEDESLSDDEMAILEAYEKSKKQQKVKEAEAALKKEEEARRILEEYERGLREAQEREAQKKKELEEKQKREIEELKKKDQFVVDQKKLEDEERKIIEEFERQARVDKEKEDAERRVKEERAQQELKALADKQKAEEEARQAEEKKRDADFQAQAVAAQAAAEKAGEKKESRLMELLAKAKAELEETSVPSVAGVAATAAVVAAPVGSAKDFLIDIEAKEADAFCHMLDESRKAMFTFLAPMIGIKAANNMLNKTVERARAKAPIVLKDVNWRVDGSLREDGSVDTDRIYKNVQSINVGTRADDFIAGLKELTQLRIKAVEAGLGAKASQDMKAKIYAARPAMAGKNHKKEWIDYFFSAIVG